MKVSTPGDKSFYPLIDEYLDLFERELKKCPHNKKVYSLLISVEKQISDDYCDEIVKTYAEAGWDKTTKCKSVDGAAVLTLIRKIYE